MAQIVNVAQFEAWNGYEGEHWAAHDARYNEVNRGFNAPVLEAAGIGERDSVLDLGCGAGALTREAARRARRGRALGVDLSGPMLERARSRAAEQGLTNVAFESADVQVYPFTPGSFDAAISRFGVMFYADPVAAFGNVGRALRPGGRLAFVCLPPLADTDFGAIFRPLLTRLPPPPDAGAADGAGPMSLAQPEVVESVLTAAGYSEISCTRVEADQIWGRDVPDAAEFIWGWGPVKYHANHAAPEAKAAARAALEEALRPFATPDGVRLRGAAWLVCAGWLGH